LFIGIAICALIYSCRGVGESSQFQEVHPLGSSKFIGVRLNTYTDTTVALVVFSEQALVDEASSRSMVFTGSSQAMSYVEGSSPPNTLWADTLRADLDNKRLNASGHCLLVNVEGDSFLTAQIFFASDSLSSLYPTRAVFSPRSERNIVLEPGEHLLDSFVYTSSKTLLWKH
tara:strand:+ start:208 stop:723 length:516 start_codon:yes stop_codon:yes gene_type:complete